MRAFRYKFKATGMTSRYATTSESEGFAEGFASTYHVNPMQQSDFTKAVGRLLRVYQRQRQYAGRNAYVSDLPAAEQPTAKERARQQWEDLLGEIGINP